MPDAVEFIGEDGKPVRTRLSPAELKEVWWLEWCLLRRAPLIAEGWLDEPLPGGIAPRVVHRAAIEELGGRRFLFLTRKTVAA